MRTSARAAVVAVGVGALLTGCGKHSPEAVQTLAGSNTAPVGAVAAPATPKPRPTAYLDSGSNPSFTGPADGEGVRPANARSYWSPLMFARNAPPDARPGITQAEALARYKRDSATGGAHGADAPQVYLGAFTRRSGSGRAPDVLDRLAWVISVPSEPIRDSFGNVHSGCVDNFVVDASDRSTLLDSRDCMS